MPPLTLKSADTGATVDERLAELSTLTAIRCCGPTVSALVTSLERLLGDGLTRVTLGPLDHDSTVALARAVNPTLDPSTAAAVADRSGGSPFWCELLAGARNVDADVARIVADRLSAAGTDAAVLLETIAVLGREAPVVGDDDALRLLAPAGHVPGDAVGAAADVLEGEVVGDARPPAVGAEDDRRLDGGVGHERPPRRLIAAPPIRQPC